MRKKDDGRNQRIDWKEEGKKFLALLPRIRRAIRLTIRNLPKKTDREEALQETDCLAWQGWRLAVLRGKNPATFSWAIGRFAGKQLLQGRRIAGKHGCNIFGGTGQGESNRPIQPLARSQGGELLHQVVACLAENLKTPPPDQAAFRIDFRVWVERLPRRSQRQVALSIAGWRTKEMAQRLGVTPGAISQHRRALAESWSAFQG